MTVVPKLFPLQSIEIDDVLRQVSAPHELVSFWRERGYGFFNFDADGNEIDEMLVNRLLHPGDILDTLEWGDDDGQNQFSFGLPFFETHDLQFLQISPSGQVLMIRGEKTTILGESLSDFLEELSANPGFYED